MRMKLVFVDADVDSGVDIGALLRNVLALAEDDQAPTSQVKIVATMPPSVGPVHTPPTTTSDTTRARRSVDRQQEHRRFLGLIGQGIATRAALVKTTAYSTSKVQRVLDALRANGEIYSTGTRRGQRWHVGQSAAPAKEAV